jgi:hypothetical protein
MTSTDYKTESTIVTAGGRRPTILRDRYGEIHYWVGFLICAVAVFAVGTGIVAAILPIAWHTNHVACLRLHEQTGYSTHMAGNMFSGECYIKPADRYIPTERYINADVNPTE